MAELMQAQRGGSAAPPALEQASARVLCGDAIDVLATLPDGSAQSCVTSPPYWGLSMRPERIAGARPGAGRPGATPQATRGATPQAASPGRASAAIPHPVAVCGPRVSPTYLRHPKVGT